MDKAIKMDHLKNHDLYKKQNKLPNELHNTLTIICDI